MRRGEQNEEQIDRALGHRLRRRILRWAADRGEAASPRVISVALEHPLPNVSYHLRRLRDAGLLDEIGQIPASGSAEHLYRLNPKAAHLQQVAKVIDIAG
ncbi:MAG TPA: helix-turn-helix domain-containing protein [Solirubrobacterales bacterium]|nr:helix-turn-helix domain-containing protein [Solirubrobacterales bacterium]